MATFNNANSNEQHHERHHNPHTSGQKPCNYKHLKKEKICELPFDQRVAYAGIRDVLYKKTDQFREHVNLVALARMSLFVLQNDLLVQFKTIAEKKPMAMDSEAASNVRGLLHEHCDALRDRDYMTEKTKSGVSSTSNPFLLRRANFMEGTLIQDLMKDFDVYPHDWGLCPHSHPYKLTTILGARVRNLISLFAPSFFAEKDLDELPGGPWDYGYDWDYQVQEQTMYERYSMAVIGSLMLIGPMLLMVLINGIIVRLVTARACTVIFAFALANLSLRTPFELMGATAAYMAVLVVFVSTSTGS